MIPAELLNTLITVAVLAAVLAALTAERLVNAVTGLTLVIVALAGGFPLDMILTGPGVDDSALAIVWTIWGSDQVRLAGSGLTLLVSLVVLVRARRQRRFP